MQLTLVLANNLKITQKTVILSILNIPFNFIGINYSYKSGQSQSIISIYFMENQRDAKIILHYKKNKN